MRSSDNRGKRRRMRISDLVLSRSRSRPVPDAAKLVARHLIFDEAADEYLDLNVRSEREAHYDLVLCSQVLEHVWDHEATFSNLTARVRPGGLLWMACPAPNREHASPEYYAAGFSPAYLRQNLKKVGFDVHDAGQIGSERLYFMTHAIGAWQSVHGRVACSTENRFATRCSD